MRWLMLLCVMAITCQPIDWGAEDQLMGRISSLQSQVNAMAEGGGPLSNVAYALYSLCSRWLDSREIISTITDLDKVLPTQQKQYLERSMAQYVIVPEYVPGPIRPFWQVQGFLASLQGLLAENDVQGLQLYFLDAQRLLHSVLNDIPKDTLMVDTLNYLNAIIMDLFND